MISLLAVARLTPLRFKSAASFQACLSQIPERRHLKKVDLVAIVLLILLNLFLTVWTLPYSESLPGRG